MREAGEDTKRSVQLDDQAAFREERTETLVLQVSKPENTIYSQRALQSIAGIAIKRGKHIHIMNVFINVGIRPSIPVNFNTERNHLPKNDTSKRHTRIFGTVEVVRNRFQIISSMLMPTLFRIESMRYHRPEVRVKFKEVLLIMIKSFVT